MIDCPPELKFFQLYSYPKIILCFLSPFGHTLPPKFFLFIFWNIHFMVNKHSSALNPCPLSCLKETPHSSLLCSFLEWWVFSSPLARLSRPSNVELKVSPDLWVMLAVYTIHHALLSPSHWPWYLLQPSSRYWNSLPDLSTTWMKPWWPLNPQKNHPLNLRLPCPWLLKLHFPDAYDTPKLRPSIGLSHHLESSHLKSQTAQSVVLL